MSLRNLLSKIFKIEKKRNVTVKLIVEIKTTQYGLEHIKNSSHGNISLVKLGNEKDKLICYPCTAKITSISNR